MSFMKRCVNDEHILKSCFHIFKTAQVFYTRGTLKFLPSLVAASLKEEPYANCNSCPTQLKKNTEKKRQ